MAETESPTADNAPAPVVDEDAARRAAAIAEADGSFADVDLDMGGVEQGNIDPDEINPETGATYESEKIAEEAERQPFKRPQRTTKIGEFPKSEPIIGITQHNGIVYVVTAKHIYTMAGRNKDKLVRMRFEFQEESLDG